MYSLLRVSDVHIPLLHSAHVQEHGVAWIVMSLNEMSDLLIEEGLWTPELRTRTSQRVVLHIMTHTSILRG